MAVWLPLYLLAIACNGDSEDTYIPTDGIEIIGLRLGPGDATERDTLNCLWESIEGATEATIAWEINKVVISGLEETTLDGTWFDKNDKVACVATPVADNADSFRSNVVEIEDAKPEVLSATIGPEEPNENTILLVDLEAEDPDPGDDVRIRAHFRWWVIEGGVSEPEERGVDENALGQAYFAKDDVVYVEVWVNAPGGSSELVETDAVLIENTPPEAPEIEVVEAEDLSSLTCVIVESSVDLDGDALTYLYAWRRFGIELAVTDANLSYPDPGASYTCTATPTDDEDEGESASDTHEVSGDPLRFRWLFDDAGARAGQLLVRFPDADGDGRDELLVSTPSSSVDSVEGGGVLLINSAAVGGTTTARPGSEWVYRTLTSPNQKQYWGTSLAWMPDMDGDGIAEIIVGAPEGKDVERVSGVVGLVPSGTWYNTASFAMSTKSEQEAMWWFPGDTDGAFMGASVAGLDANGDGVGDAAIGALFQHGSDQGNVTLLDGAQLDPGGGAVFNDGIMTEISGNGGRFGYALAVGDYDGDGTADLAVGAPNDSDEAGSVYLFADLPSQIPESEETSDTGPGGAAAILSAQDRWKELEGEMAGDHLGQVLATGDIDGDGTDDLLLGAPDAQSGAGAVYLWIGNSSDTGWTAYVAVGAEGDSLGASVSSLGDLDGGGIGDIIAGAPENETAYARGGGAYVFSGEAWGASGGTLTVDDASWYLPGEAEGERSGSAVLGTGDLDGDGWPDIAVGIPGVDEPEIGVDVGGVNLWVGVDGL